MRWGKGWWLARWDEGADGDWLDEMRERMVIGWSVMREDVILCFVLLAGCFSRWPLSRWWRSLSWKTRCLSEAKNWREKIWCVNFLGQENCIYSVNNNGCIIYINVVGGFCFCVHYSAIFVFDLSFFRNVIIVRVRVLQICYLVWTILCQFS